MTPVEVIYGKALARLDNGRWLISSGICLRRRCDMPFRWCYGSRGEATCGSETAKSAWDMDIRSVLAAGEELPIADLPSGPAMILARSEHGQFCQASRFFHEELIRRSINQSTKVVVLIPPGEGVDSNLHELGATKAEVSVHQELAVSASVPAVPAIIFVNNRRIVRSWVGMLTQSQEQEVDAQLAEMGPGRSSAKNSASSATKTGTPKQAAIPAMSTGGLANLGKKFVLVDLRTRDKFKVRLEDYQDVTRNIPKEEIYGRYFELTDQEGPIVLDCGSVPAVTCDRARERLLFGGVRDVRLLDLGSYTTTACTTF